MNQEQYVEKKVEKRIEKCEEGSHQANICDEIFLSVDAYQLIIQLLICVKMYN